MNNHVDNDLNLCNNSLVNNEDNVQECDGNKIKPNEDYEEMYQYTQEDEDEAIYSSIKGRPKEKKKKDDSSKDVSSTASKVSSGLTTSLIASSVVVIVAAIGVGVIHNNNTISSPPIYKVSEIGADENKVFYDISVDDNASLNLTFTLKGADDYLYELNVTEVGHYVGQVENLNYSSTYEWYLTGTKGTASTTYEKGEVTIGEKTKRTEVISYKWECHCLVDGTATFTLDIEDDFDYWSDYELMVYSSDDDEFNINESFTSEQISGDHVFDVSKALGGDYSLLLTCKSSDPDDVSQVDPSSLAADGKAFKTLLSITVEI